MEMLFALEVIWLGVSHYIPFIPYKAGAIAILIAWLVLWILEQKEEKARQKAEDEERRTWGSHLTKEEIAERKKDPQFRNQKRGRGPGNWGVDPESCEICGAGVRRDVTSSYYWSKCLCHDCEQRYQRALKNNETPHIPGYTDDERSGEGNMRDLWTKLQIIAIDLQDGVIDEQTARAEVAAAMDEGKRWAEQQRVMKVRERQQQEERRRDYERNSHLNEEVQRLLNCR